MREERMKSHVESTVISYRVEAVTPGLLVTATSETWHPASILAASWLSQPFSGLGFSSLPSGIASFRNLENPFPLKKQGMENKRKRMEKEEKTASIAVYPSSNRQLRYLKLRVPGSPFLTSAPDHRPARMQSKSRPRFVRASGVL